MITPSFALDFSAAPLDSRITFTRSGSTATVVGSNGYITSVAADTPRFDYNPVTLVSKGLLIEEARTNLLLYSNDFSNVVYTKSRASIAAGGITAPDGTTNCWKLIEDTTASNTHRMFQGLTFAATANTVSIFAKAAGRDFIYFTLADSGGTARIGYFNISNGTLGTVPTNMTMTITDFGGGWYRCTATVTTAAGANNWLVGLANANNGAAYTGDGVSGAYLFGGGFEAGAFPTSYIPTTLLPLTRNADVATITGTDFSDFWQAAQGGTVAQVRPGTVSGTRPWVQFDDGTANEIIALRGNTTNPELYIVDGGTPQAQLDAGTIAANTQYALTGWWATNDCKARLNGDAVVTDTTATIPTVTQMRIGSDGTNYLNGHVATISYYDTFSGQIYTRRKNKVIFNLI